MATKTDLITRTLRRMGVTSLHSAVRGNDYQFAKDILDDYLLAINSVQSLDFDPTGDDIPAERMWPLSVILGQLIGGPYGKPSNDQVIKEYHKQLYAGVVGESNFVEQPVVDY